ncbi:hypothetical protein C4J81_00135 [Deltaproteobacteria bacterium Smac51]|nr:hypothetical protein C4J81_00135 [Deltaproteobacteria bacterium Smac51]
MDWNKTNPRFRRPGRRRKKGTKRPGFFARLGAKLDGLLRRAGGKPPTETAADKKRTQTPPPPAVEEIFDDLKISLPRGRTARTRGEAVPAAPAKVSLINPADDEALGEEAEAAFASEDFELDDELDKDYLSNDEETDTEIFDDIIFLDEDDSEAEDTPVKSERDYTEAAPLMEFPREETRDEAAGGLVEEPLIRIAEPDDSGAGDILSPPDMAEETAEEPPLKPETVRIAEAKPSRHKTVCLNMPEDQPTMSNRPARESDRRRSPLMKLAAAVVVVALLGGGIWWLARQSGLFSGSAPTAKVAIIPAASLPKVDTPPPGLFELYAERENQAVITEYEVSQGSTLSQAMEALGFGLRTDGTAIIDCLTGDQGVAVVRPGAVVRAFWSDEEKTNLMRLEYHPSSGAPPFVVRPRGDGTFWRYNLAAPTLTVTTAAAGTVESTLWEAGYGAGVDGTIIMNMADIMASEIDFLSDIQKGDSFQVLYSRNYADGKPVGSAVVEMLVMINKGTSYELYRYVNSNGDVGYYDEKQRSNKKVFFNSPLQYTRISSGFSMNRLHPIHKVRRAHQGVDYAAPTGTPVSSVADGVVVFAGWNGGYGRLVTIKHDEVYTTMYAHLSRFAKGLKKGSKVNQGDLIGYVGATGTATGPHLDFRMKRNNVFIDPQSVLARQEGRVLEGADAQAFSQIVVSARNRMKEFLESRRSN